MPISNIIFYAFLGGVLPAVVWLLFWLKEDSRHPESPYLISKTFLAGMFVVVLVLPFQSIADHLFPGVSTTTLILWAALEEGFKLLAAYFIAIRTRDDDEPVDAMIYMITVALGFVALENTLFLINPLLQQDIASALVEGGMRFVGSSLLHVVSSSIIGAAFALTFYKRTRVRALWISFSFILAVLVHTIFNILIYHKNNSETLMTFGAVWVGVIILLLLFEKVKTLQHKTLDI